MKRTLFPVFLLMMASAAAFGDNSTMPDGTQFPVWEKPMHFTRTYYVDGQAKNADDNGPGTKEHPFKTINHAAQGLQPGERVKPITRMHSRISWRITLQRPSDRRLRNLMVGRMD
jgi:hypothetical protein